MMRAAFKTLPVPGDDEEDALEISAWRSILSRSVGATQTIASVNPASVPAVNAGLSEQRFELLKRRKPYRRLAGDLN